MAEVQDLFSQLDQHQLMGFVTDQSPYYPFMTSGSGPPRQARIVVSLKQTKISGCQCWSHALPTGQDARVGRVQRGAGVRRNEAAEQQVSSETRVESRCSRLVLPPLLVEASPGGASALPVQCHDMQHHYLLQSCNILQHSVQPRDSNQAPLWNKYLGRRDNHKVY